VVLLKLNQYHYVSTSNSVVFAFACIATFGGWFLVPKGLTHFGIHFSSCKDIKPTDAGIVQADESASNLLNDEISHFRLFASLLTCQ
jgi:hypothetical protein